MALRFLLCIFFCISSISTAWVEERPVLETREGNLIIASAKDKNITLQTFGNGTIKINDIDLVEVSLHARKAVLDVEKWKTGYLRDLTSRVDRLIDAVEGPDGLQDKLNSIQSGNNTQVNFSTTIAAPGSQINNGDQLSRTALIHLSNRIDKLESKLRTISTKLREDVCATDPCKNGGTCINIYDGFQCICPSNWEGSGCTEDVNECEIFANTTLGCQNGAKCRNLPGSYRCDCSTGWHGIHCNTKWIECDYHNSRKLCGHGECVLTREDKWGYTCQCDQGWKSDGIDPACTTDIDECTEGPEKCPLDPLVPCINLPGGYKCGSCPPGYTGNGRRCFDIDECLVDNGGCSTEPMVDCKNTIGSRECGNCPSGYQGDGTSCTYVGVCEINNGGCHPRATCVESPVFTNVFPQCICPDGYHGDGVGPKGCELGSDAKDLCDSNPCNHGICISNTTNYFCFCRDGFTGSNCDSPIDPCSSNPCHNDGVCESEDSVMFTCECTSDFWGPTCESPRQPCGGLFRNPRGTLRYPMPDERPKESLFCAYIIVTDKSKVLNITFIEFDIEPSENCESTFLQINDGRNDGAHLLGRYCNSSLPVARSLTTTHNAVHLLLRSNKNTDRIKFFLRWDSVAPECGGLLSGDHGTISSPGSPGKYPNNRDCTWQVSVKPGKRIQFHFYSVSLEQHPTCDNDYVEISEVRGDKDIRLSRFCNHSHPAPLLTSGSFAKVHFHSDASGNDLGFQMSYSTVEGVPGCGGVFTTDHGIISTPGYPSKYTPNTVCEWKIQLQQGLKVRLTWTGIDLERGGGCEFDSVKVFSGADTESTMVGKYCGEKLPPAVTINSNVVLIVFATNNPFGERRGFQLAYETVCGAEFHEPSGIIKSLHYPDSYPEKGVCIYEIIQPPRLGIILTIVDMDIPDHGNQPCHVDHLDIYGGESDKSPRLGRICGDIEDTPIRPFFLPLNHMYLKFSTSGKSAGNRGFLANYTTYNRDCDGIWTAPTGVIESTRYNQDENCTWMIKAPEGHVVQITFETFQFSSESNYCNEHFVSIYDGVIGLGQEIGRYCATHPPVLTSQGNTMTIMHTSTDGIDEFEIRYVFLDTTKACGGHFFTSAGLITTPNYPNPYPMHTHCEWIITVPNKRQITLNVKDFKIDYIMECRTDSLEVRAGGSEASIRIGKYCGTSIPRTLKSFTNQMYLKFVSHSNDQRGFSIEWDSSTFGCGGTLTGSNGEIFSPNYPEPYNHLASCVWKIRTNIGNLLRIIFVDLDIKGDENCASDYIEISSGLEDHRRRRMRYCDIVSSPIELDSNLATIRFRSDHTNAGRGFHIKYESTCVHKVRGYDGIIESPNFPHQYPGRANCSWIIEAPKGNKLDITFSHFRLPRIGSGWLSNCPVDFVSIKEGSDDKPNTELGKFCYADTLPERISSTRNQIFLHFEASPYFAYEGFRLEWRVVGCGGRLSKPSGDFSSPGYPDTYLKNIECEWLIEVDHGHSVEIQFSNLNLGNLGGCDLNKIQLYGGTDRSDPILATLCHAESSVKYTSPTNKMFVQFIANAQLAWSGWKATYKSVELTCGGTFRALTGIIHSPNYPLNYPNNQNCEWLIEVDKNHIVNLNFTDFDIDDTTNCVTNYVKVFDGTSRDAPYLGSFCKTELPPLITSTGNAILVVMRTDRGGASKGFKAQFRKACGARIVTNGTGVLDALIDPHNGVENHCTWTIVASDPADHVTISFSYMEIASTPNCTDHYVRVYEGEGTDGPVRNIYCSSKIPLPVTSAGNALTVHIYGDKRDRVEATYSVFDSACGGEHMSAEGTIASPGYPDEYPTNAECVWLLKTSPGNVIKLTFSTFELMPSPNCDRHYLEIRQESAIGKLIGIYCFGQPSPIKSSKNLWIKFRSDNGGSVKGFLGEYEITSDLELTGINGEISSPLYPYPWKGEKSLTWRITVENNMAIRVEFDEVHIPQGGVSPNSLEIYDGNNDEFPRLALVRGLSPPTDPIVSSSNVIFLKYSSIFLPSSSSSIFPTDNWFHLNWYADFNYGRRNVNTFTKISDCNSKYDLTSTENSAFVFQSPGWPNRYNNDLDCTWVFTSLPGYHLNMKLLALDLENTVNCIADYVTVYNGNGLATVPDNSQILKTVCHHNEIDKTIQGSSVMTVKFHSDFFLGGTGFQAKVWLECGGEYGGPNGVIDSNLMWSSHDKSTPNIACEWYITVHRGRTIEVTFDKFSVGNNEELGCHDNYLLLKNGADSESPLLDAGKFCDKTKPPAKLKTTGNKLYIKAVGLQQQLNFKLLYKEVKMSCGGSYRLGVTNTQVSLNSPNYPNIPPSFSECIWTFLAPAGERLTLHFVDRFDLTTSSNCTKEYVEVRDGGTEHSVSLGAFCGNMPPSSMTTTGNMMYVHFYTDVADPKNGFNATVTSGEVCGRLLRGETGVVMSPNYPFTYPIDQECSWTIVGPPGHTLSMEFQDLDLPSVYNCADTDFVKIDQRHLFENNVSNLGYWCGTNKPAPVETSSNIAVVSFHSGNTAVADYRGFSLNYTASKETCGGEISGPTGIFQTPGYPNRSTSSRSCEWLIIGPEGYLVSLFIRDTYNANKTSRLKFYNDKHAKSEITPAGISDRRSPDVQSSSNYMLVVYEFSAGQRGFVAEYVTVLSDLCGSSLNDEEGSLPPSGYQIKGSFFCHWKLRAPDSLIDLGNGTTFTLDVSGSLGEYSRQSRSCEDRPKYISVSDGQHKIGMVCGDLTKDTKVVRSPSPVNIIEFMNGTLGGNVHVRMDYYWKACGGILKGPSHTISAPENMEYPKSCVWHAQFDDPGAVISMDIKRINLETCDMGYLLVRNGGPLSPIIDVYCGNTKPSGIITSSTNQLWIEYWAAKPPDDVEFELNLVSGSCGGAMRGASKEIMSPGFPKQYPKNAECTWEITADPGFTVGLIFVDRFNLETSDLCKNDFVQIFNWVYDASGVGGWDEGIKYCGRNAPSAFNSTSNRLKVLFRSNDEIQGDGFRARWEQNCGGIFEATSRIQSIQSPHYPDVYPPNQICNYTIQAPHGKEISIEFTDFDMESTDVLGQCKFDNLTATGLYQYSNFRSYLDRTKVMCGDDIPSLLYMLGRVYVVFQSDAHIEKRGYRFQYMLTECGGEITEPTQLRPPRTKIGGYFGRFNCTWIIRAPQQKSVVLRFEKLNIPSSFGCYSDVLRAVEGDTLQTVSSLARLCGTTLDILPPVKSVGNVMTVMFWSDGTKGFGEMGAMVTFSNNEASGCGGKVHLESSMPFTTQKKVMYDPFEECQWKITVEPGKNVRLTINHMDLKNSTNGGESTDGSCNGDFLEVRDGSSPTSELIGRYCSTVPPPITSTTNALWIRFFSDDAAEGEGVRAILEPIDSPCGKHYWVISNETVVIESPEYPENFPAGIECRWIFKSHQPLSILRMHFDYMDMEESPSCIGDRLEISHEIPRYMSADNRNEDSIYENRPRIYQSIFRMDPGVQQPYRYCGETTPGIHYSETNELHVLLKTTAENLPKPRKFRFEVEKATCNRNYTAEQGRIINRDISDCWITITAPPDHTISLYFNYFIFFRGHCSTSYLKIYDGDFSANETSLCGTVDPDPIFSTGNKLSLHAKSTWLLQFGGPRFDLLYTTTDNGRGCGGKLYNYEGVFTSPMYPRNYRTEGTCEWEINVPRGYSVGLTFVFFDLGDSDCASNYLKIRDMYRNEEVYCSGSETANYRGRNDKLTVIYASSGNDSSIGWKIRFAAILTDSDERDSSEYSDMDYI